MKGIALSALGLLLLAALAACGGQIVEIQVTEDSTVNVWTPDGTIHTIPLDNIVIHGIENMPTATPIPTRIGSPSTPAPTPYATPAKPVSIPQSESYEYWDVDRLVQIWNALPKTENAIVLDLAADEYDGRRVSFSGSVKSVGSHIMGITVVSDDDLRLSSVDVSVNCDYSSAVDRQYLASLNNGDQVKIYGVADVGANAYSSIFINGDLWITLRECLVESVN